MSAGLSVWENCGEKNLHWGVITMQKTGLSSSQPDSPRAEHISKIPQLTTLRYLPYNMTHTST